MIKFIFSLTLLSLCMSISAKGQYYMFGTSFMCASDTTGTYENAEKDISASLSALMDAGEVYSFEVNSHEHDNDDATDSLHFMVMVFAKEQAQFDAITKKWEDDNPDVLEVLTGKCPIRTDEKFGDETAHLPLIKNARTAVYDVEKIDVKPDPSIQYNIVIDFTAFQKVPGEEGHTHNINPKPVNWGLIEIGRLINLHIGAGIPAENIHIVAAAHGMSTDSFMSNEAYQKEYHMDNPNAGLISELANAGVSFLLCGQSLGSLKKEDLLPETKITLTAQTTLSEYQMKGYALKKMSND